MKTICKKKMKSVKSELKEKMIVPTLSHLPIKLHLSLIKLF